MPRRVLKGLLIKKIVITLKSTWIQLFHNQMQNGEKTTRVRTEKY